MKIKTLEERHEGLINKCNSSALKVKALMNIQEAEIQLQNQEDYVFHQVYKP